MGQTIRWSPVAHDDLRDAVAYIAEGSPAYADALIDTVFEAVDGLSTFPRMGHVVPEFDRPDLRQISVRPYRLIYQVRSDDVLVVALVHGARDLGRAWQGRSSGD